MRKLSDHPPCFHTFCSLPFSQSPFALPLHPTVAFPVPASKLLGKVKDRKDETQARWLWNNAVPEQSYNCNANANNYARQQGKQTRSVATRQPLPLSELPHAYFMRREATPANETVQPINCTAGMLAWSSDCSFYHHCWHCNAKIWTLLMLMIFSPRSS